MTVRVIYAPRVVPAKSPPDFGYDIPWEFADRSSIEVYEIQQSENQEERRRERVRPQDFNVTERKELASPVNRGGGVVFTRPHPSWVTHVSIERNTLIDQTLDLRGFGNFNTRMVEFALDKATMIAQELVQRKCTAISSILITQEVTFTYRDLLRPEEVNFAVDKIVTILREISQTAVDCKDDLENA